MEAYRYMKEIIKWIMTSTPFPFSSLYAYFEIGKKDNMQTLDFNDGLV